MENIQDLKLLSTLYRYRALGIDYFESKKKTIFYDKDDFDLPNNLDKLKDTAQKCFLCQLSKGRKNVVFGEGNPKADLMFIGEGPGAVEDEMGRPFVGRSGELLTKIIETTLELKREDLYIANIVKCRPPMNRAPTEDEAKTCLPYLLKQIELIDPKIIVTLGSTGYKYLTGDLKSSISKIRGEIINYSNIILMPTFHPSFLLRNPSAKRYVFNDMKKIKAML